MKRLRTTAVLAAVLLLGTAFAAPPTLTIPSDLKPVSGYVRFTPQTDAKAVIYLSLDEAYPFPSDELKDVRRFILPVVGLKDGPYRFLAIGSLNDEMTVVPFTVVAELARSAFVTKPVAVNEPVAVRLGIVLPDDDEVIAAVPPTMA